MVGPKKKKKKKTHTASKEAAKWPDHLRLVTRAGRAEHRWGTHLADRWVCRNFIS